MYSRYTSCKRVPKKRTKKRQTQVKRQGSSETSRIKLESVETSRIKLESVETSRIKLEIVETSQIKLETVETSQIKLEIVETSRIKLETVETSRKKNWKLIKHLAFQTEKTHRRERPQQLVAQIGGKVVSPKVRKQVIRSEENSDTMSTTSRTNPATSDSNCIEIHARQAFQQVGCNQVNWS